MAMTDRFTEIERVGIFERLVGAVGGMLVGLVLFIAAFPLLIWNEGRAVKDFRSIAEGESVVATVVADRLDPAHDGELVHFSAVARPATALSDPELPVSVPDALRLRRNVEMYQWVENTETRTRTELGGTETRETIYTYTRQWRSGYENSGRFRHPAGHENPAARYESLTLTARDVTAGAFRLPDGLVSRLEDFRPLSGTMEAVDLPPGLDVRGSGFYYSIAAATATSAVGAQRPTAVGDQRISISAIPAQTVTVVGRQAGDTIEPYRTSNGRSLHMIRAGQLSAADMFAVARDEAALMTWSLRAVGLVVMAFGLARVLRPLSVAASVIPALGSLIGSATGMVAIAVALPLALTTISIAWIAYRPVLAVCLIAAGVLMGGTILVLLRRRDAAATGAGEMPEAGSG